MLTNPFRTEMTSDAVSHPPINWRQEYLHLAVILMTACWMSGWVALSLGWFLTISMPTALGLTVVHMVASMLLVRWMVYRGVNNNLQLTTTLLLTWGAAGITVLLTPALTRAYGSSERIALADLFFFDQQERTPGGPFVILWVLLLWWRGASIGNMYTTLVRASFGMRLGLLTLLITFLAAGPDLREDMLAVVPFFFFFGLLASSLARADSLNLDRARHPGFGRGWMLSLLTVALVVTMGGYAAALWFSGMSMEQIAEPLGTIGEVVLTLLFLIASPILLLAQLAYNFIKATMPDSFGTIIPTPSGDDSSGSQTQAPWLSDLFTILGDALMAGVVILIVISLIAFIWFLFVARSERRHYQDEEREALGTGEVVGGLQQTLRDSWRRLAELLGVLRRFGLGPDLFAALTVRRIYARMEKLAKMRGYPRSMAETPYEYRRELEQAFPGQTEAIQCITEAYIAVRYGEIPEDPAKLQAVHTAWETLKATPEPA